MPTVTAETQRPDSNDMVEGLKLWVTPRVIIANIEHAQKLAGYGDYISSSNTYGS